MLLTNCIEDLEVYQVICCSCFISQCIVGHTLIVTLIFGRNVDYLKISRGQYLVVI